MAQDIFIKIGKIKGEAKDKSHKEEIDVLAWSWGASQSGSFHVGGGGGAGKANFQDISFTKYLDASSPELLKALATGEHIDEAVLTVRKAGKSPLEYYKITMRKLLISSYSTGGSGGEDRLTENVTLNFADFTVDYVSQDDKTGGAGDNYSCSFNIEENILK